MREAKHLPTRNKDDYWKQQDQLVETLGLKRVDRGNDDPEVLRVVSELAEQHVEFTNYKMARPLLEEALVGHRIQLGDDSDSPDMLRSVHLLGECELASRRWKAARPLLEEALAGRRRVLGDGHLDTQRSIGALAELFSRTKRYPQAAALLVEAVGFSRRRYGDAHPYTLLHIRELAKLHEAGRDLAAARPLYEEVLAARRQRLETGAPAQMGGALGAGNDFKVKNCSLAEALAFAAANAEHVRGLTFKAGKDFDPAAAW
eukprot:SAG22_NODE_3274_length_1812_cov_1.203736_1_plen_259_part_10